MKKLNKTGTALVLIYIVIAGGLLIKSLNCSGFMCGLGMYLPFFLWFSINTLEHVFTSMPAPVSYSIFSIANIAVLYSIGMLLSFIFGKFRKK